MPSGCFISFEGGEGAGKSTQIQRLKSALEKRGHQVLVTREPGGSTGAEEIRGLLVKGAPGRWDSMTELLLLYAARRDHVEKVIKPALTEGTWVLCDRFADSTTAYQGYGHGLDLEIVACLHKLVLGDFRPDLTFLMDLDPETGLGRANARQDDENRFESMALAFHNRMRDGFLEIAAAQPERFAVIDAGQPLEAVWDSLWAVAQKRLGIS